jgi:hypothetical protein
MKKSLLIVAFAASCILPAYSQKSSDEKAENKDKPVTITGCVEAGVVAGCLVLKDTKTQVLYDLKFDQTKAAVGDAITFDGTFHSGEVDICQQGKIVHVAKWTKLKMHCPMPEKGKAEQK